MVETDAEGYLVNLDDWSEEVAVELAANIDIELDQRHLEVAQLLRDIYAEYQHTPVTRIMVKMMKEKLGADKGTSMYLLQLFPDTPMRKACLVAGLPKPTNCF